MTLLRAAVDFTALFGDNIHHRKPRFDDEFLQTLAPPCGLIAAAGHTDKDLAPLLPFVAVSPAQCHIGKQSHATTGGVVQRVVWCCRFLRKRCAAALVTRSGTEWHGVARSGTEWRLYNESRGRACASRGSRSGRVPKVDTFQDTSSMRPSRRPRAPPQRPTSQRRRSERTIPFASWNCRIEASPLLVLRLGVTPRFRARVFRFQR